MITCVFRTTAPAIGTRRRPLTVGAWASSGIDFGPGIDADVELDIYAGYTGEINDTFSWVAGGNYYTYPGADDAVAAEDVERQGHVAESSQTQPTASAGA